MLHNAMMHDIGNYKGDDLLIHALMCMIMYIRKKTETTEENEEDKINSPQGEYSINEAFEDTFKKKHSFPTTSPRMIPSPS